MTLKTLVGRSGSRSAAPVRRTALLSSLAGSLAALLVAVSVPSASATFPGRNGLILFNRGGDLYTASATGGAVTRLTTTGGIGGAKWSPDGERIAYSRAGSVYVRTVATGRTIQVAGAQGVVQWSPDGTRLAFLSTTDPSCGDVAIFSVPATGGTPRLDFTPPWDDLCGERGTHRYSLGTYTAAGTILLTTCYDWRNPACWIDEVSLDGTDSTRTIAVVSCPEELEFPQDGSAPKCNDGMHLSDARLTPSGSGMLFSGKGGYRQLPGSTALPTSSTLEKVYAVGLSGAELHRVSTASAGHSATTSPDGRTVLFTQTVNGVRTIMKVAGTSTTATASALIANAGQADWQPVP